MTSRHLIAANTASQIAGKIITGASTFGVNIMLARALGVSGFGDYTKVVSYTALFYLLCDFGMNASYLDSSISPDGNTDNPTPIRTLIAARTVISLSVMFLSLAILAFLPHTGTEGYPPPVKLAIILFTPTIFLQGAITTANAVFQKHLSYIRSTFALAAGSIVTLVLVSFFYITLKPGLLFPAGLASVLAGSAVTAVLAWKSMRQLEPDAAPDYSFRRLRTLVSTSAPLALTLAFNAIYFRADTIVMSLVRPPADVGLYGFAYKLFEFPLVLPTFFMNAVYPLLLSALAAQDHSLYRKRLRRSAAFLFFLSLAVSALVFVLAPQITRVRADFAPAILPFRILALGLPVFFLSSVTMWALISSKRTWMLLWIYGSSMVFNILANILFIPKFGPTAAAVITGASETYVLILSLAVLSRQSRL